MATTIERTARAQQVEGPEVKRNGGMVLVRARLDGITPLLFNAMSMQQLLNMRDKVKAPKNAPKPTPREEADSKVHRMPDGDPHIPVTMLMSCLIGAGQFVRLDGKRQVSTAKSTVLPGLLTIEDRYLPLTPKAYEVDVQQGRNPNGGEAVCIVSAMRAAKRDAKIADAELNRPKKAKRARPKRPAAYGSPWSGRPQPPQWTAGRSTTMPREQNGACINPKRRERRQVAAGFREEHGRRINPKDVKRQKCADRGVPYKGQRVPNA